MITCILVKEYLKVSAIYFYPVLIFNLFWSSNIEENMEARIGNIIRTNMYDEKW